MSLPSTLTDPFDGEKSPVIKFTNVLLPAPELPIIPIQSPLFISNEIYFSIILFFL